MWWDEGRKVGGGYEHRPENRGGSGFVAREGCSVPRAGASGRGRVLLGIFSPLDERVEGVEVREGDENSAISVRRSVVAERPAALNFEGGRVDQWFTLFL